MKYTDLARAVTVKGSAQFTRENEGIRKVSFPLVTEGASVIVTTGSDQAVVFSGRGATDVAFIVNGSFTVTVSADDDAAMTTVVLPWDLAQEIGWEDGPSFFQHDLKAPDAISPEVSAALARMQANQLLRENALRAEIQRLTNGRR